MLNLRESIKAIGLARNIVRQETPVSATAAREYLELCRRSEDVPPQPESDTTTLARLKTRAQPVLPIVLACYFALLGIATQASAFLLFIPALLFAAGLARLHRQALDRVEFLLAGESA